MRSESWPLLTLSFRCVGNESVLDVDLFDWSRFVPLDEGLGTLGIMADSLRSNP